MMQMHQLGLKWLGTRVAMKIMITRALCLESNHLARVPFHAALLGKGSSWMTQAQMVAQALGALVDFFEHRASMRLLELSCSDAARLAVREWQDTVVKPQLERVERQRLFDQASKWSVGHMLAISSWDAGHCRFRQVVRSLLLSKTMWRHARGWLFVLLTNAFPFGVIENSSRICCNNLHECPWCRAETDVHHVLVECSALPITRVANPLGKSLDIEELKAKFPFVSRITRFTWSRCQ